MTRISLKTVAQEQMKLAIAAPTGRSGHSLLGGVHHQLRQVVIALKAGRVVPTHDNPGDATVYVLQGRVRVRVIAQTFDADAGDIVLVPDSLHTLEALEDSVVLVTVINRP